MSPLDAPDSGGSGERVCVACGTRYPSGTRFCASDGQVLRDDSLPDESLVGRLIAERYYIERRLGVGGMGVVYLAQQVFMSRRCALKVLRPEFLSNADALGRFARGAQNAARIVHPNVAAVYDFGEVEGESMYLAMEYVEGDSLGTLLENSSYLPLARCIVIVAQVAAALKAAHDLGIVHRDLKPENVMLVSAGAGDVVKVVDFGIARAIAGDMEIVTDSKVIIGTPAYMSPEQITGGEVDQRSDLYSLALVTCEILSGKLPLSSERSEIVMRFLQKPRTLQELRPEVRWPAGLQAVLDKALAVNPGDRQENVMQFGREFIDACRNWRSADVADALTTLTALGMSVSMALPSEAIVTMATPTPQPAFAPGKRPRIRSRVWLAISGAVAAGLGAVAIAASMASNVEDPGPSPAVETPAPVPVVEAPKAAPDTSTPAGEQQREPPATPPPTLRRPPPVTRPAVAESRESDPVKVDSAPADSAKPPLVAAPEPQALPPFGSIRIGSRLGAMLIIASDSGAFVRELRTFVAPAGDSVRVRLRLDSCRDWDSIVTVRAGQIVQLGYRNPTCPPR